MALILVNALVFGYEVMLGPGARAFVNEFALIPVELVHGANLPFSPSVPPFATLLTSMFLHGGLMHLLGNVWFLWIFGDNIEDTMGHVGFLIFYFVTGIAAGLAHVLMMPDSTTPTLGASGAVSGILGAYLVLFPRIRIRTFVFLGFFYQVARVPAVVFLVLWFVVQSLGLFGGEGGVAFGAHLGGFVAGVALAFVFARRAPEPRYRYEPRRVPRW